MSLPLWCVVIGAAWLLLYAVLFLVADTHESMLLLISQLWFIAAVYFLHQMELITYLD